MTNLYRVKYGEGLYHGFSRFEDAKQSYIEQVEKGFLGATCEMLTEEGWTSVVIDRVADEIHEDDAFQSFVKWIGLP